MDIGEISIIFGWVGGVLTLLGFINQTYKSFKDNDFSNLNIKTFVINSVGALLWIANGITMPKMTPSVVINFSILMNTSILLFLYLKWKTQKVKLSLIIMFSIQVVALSVFIIAMINGDKASFIPHNDVASMVIVILAGMCISISFIPQAYTTITSKNTSSLSLGMLILYGGSQILWITFWVLKSGDNDVSLMGWVPGLIFTTIVFVVQVLLFKMKISDVWKSKHKNQRR